MFIQFTLKKKFVLLYSHAIPNIPMIRPEFETPYIKVRFIHLIIEKLHLPYFVANKRLPFLLPHRRHTATMRLR